MKKKLTLTVEEEAVREVKRLAKRRGESVSSLFERWSLQIVAQDARKSLGVELAGKWKQTEDLSLDDIRLEALLKKHVSG